MHMCARACLALFLSLSLSLCDVCVCVCVCVYEPGHVWTVRYSRISALEAVAAVAGGCDAVVGG